MFTVRLLDASDAPEYLRLRLEGLLSDPVAFGSSWEEEHTQTPESVAPRLAAVPEGNFVMGAFDADHLIGLVGFRRTDRPKTRHKGFVWGVYVTAGARGQGVARALLLAVLERARSYSGLDQITLSVAVPQAPARRLYTSLGFEVFGYEQHALKIEDTYIDEEHRVFWITHPPDQQAH